MAVIEALPSDHWSTAVPALLERAVAENPAYFLQPCRPAEIAELLGTTTSALATLRWRGGGPSWRKIGSSVVYESRLSALQWARREMGLASGDTRRAA
jgi:hypothetical protein